MLTFSEIWGQDLHSIYRELFRYSCLSLYLCVSLCFYTAENWKNAAWSFSSVELYSFSEPVPTVACSWLIGGEPDVVVCCCCPSASRFGVLCVPRCFYAHHRCKELLSSLINKVFLPTALALTECFLNHSMCQF